MTASYLTILSLKKPCSFWPTGFLRENCIIYANGSSEPRVLRQTILMKNHLTTPHTPPP